MLRDRQPHTPRIALGPLDIWLSPRAAPTSTQLSGGEVSATLMARDPLPGESIFTRISLPRGGPLCARAGLPFQGRSGWGREVRGGSFPSLHRPLRTTHHTPPQDRCRRGRQVRGGELSLAPLAPLESTSTRHRGYLDKFGSGHESRGGEHPLPGTGPLSITPLVRSLAAGRPWKGPQQSERQFLLAAWAPPTPQPLKAHTQ